MVEENLSEIIWLVILNPFLVPKNRKKSKVKVTACALPSGFFADP